MEFVRCTEVVRLSECPLLEVSLYMYVVYGHIGHSATNAVYTLVDKLEQPNHLKHL